MSGMEVDDPILEQVANDMDIDSDVDIVEEDPIPSYFSSEDDDDDDDDDDNDLQIRDNIQDVTEVKIHRFDVKIKNMWLVMEQYGYMTWSFATDQERTPTNWQMKVGRRLDGQCYRHPELVMPGICHYDFWLKYDRMRSDANRPRPIISVIFRNAQGQEFRACEQGSHWERHCAWWAELDHRFFEAQEHIRLEIVMNWTRDCKQSCQMASSLTELWESRRFADAYIGCRDTYLPVHRAVLAACSERFELLFANPLPYQLNGARIYAHDGCPPEDMRRLLLCLYTEQLPEFERYAARLLALAQFFGIRPMIEAIARQLPRRLNVDLALDVIMLDEVTGHDLLYRALWYVISHAEDVLNSERGRRDPDSIQEVLSRLTSYEHEEAVQRFRAWVRSQDWRTE